MNLSHSNMFKICKTKKKQLLNFFQIKTYPNFAGLTLPPPIIEH